jgi:hypothetical protein
VHTYLQFSLSGISIDASVQDKVSDDFGSVGEFGYGQKEADYRKKRGRVASG